MRRPTISGSVSRSSKRASRLGRLRANALSGRWAICHPLLSVTQSSGQCCWAHPSPRRTRPPRRDLHQQVLGILPPRRPVRSTDRTFTTAAPSGTRCTQRLETPSRGSTGMSRMPTTRRSINRAGGGCADMRPSTSLPRCSLCQPTFERSKHSSENKARMKV